MGWINQKTVAGMLEVTVTTLANWRGIAFGPAHYRVGRRRIRYKSEEVEAWREAQRGK